MATKNIKPGDVVSFDEYDTGSYSVLVEEVNGSKIKGPVIYFSSCYEGACYPDSIVPVVIKEEHDLAEETILQKSIRVKEASEEEMNFLAHAKKEQAKFIKTMVPLSKTDEHTYQELAIRIEKTDVERMWVKKGTYCQIDVTNIVGFDHDGEFKNPYVVQRTMNANSIKQMEDGYDYYGSLRGVIVPETTIKFSITHVKEDETVEKICKVVIPYEEVKKTGMDIFPVELEDCYKEKIKNVLAFLSLHEEGKNIFS